MLSGHFKSSSSSPNTIFLSGSWPTIAEIHTIFCTTLAALFSYFIHYIPTLSFKCDSCFTETGTQALQMNQSIHEKNSCQIIVVCPSIILFYKQNFCCFPRLCNILFSEGQSDNQGIWTLMVTAFKNFHISKIVFDLRFLSKNYVVLHWLHTLGLISEGRIYMWLA